MYPIKGIRFVTIPVASVRTVNWVWHYSPLKTLAWMNSMASNLKPSLSSGSYSVKIVFVWPGITVATSDDMEHIFHYVSRSTELSIQRLAIRTWASVEARASNSDCVMSLFEVILAIWYAICRKRLQYCHKNTVLQTATYSIAIRCH